MARARTAFFPLDETEEDKLSVKFNPDRDPAAYGTPEYEMGSPGGWRPVPPAAVPPVRVQTSAPITSAFSADESAANDDDFDRFIREAAGPTPGDTIPSADDADFEAFINGKAAQGRKDMQISSDEARDYAFAMDPEKAPIMQRGGQQGAKDPEPKRGGHSPAGMVLAGVGSFLQQKPMDKRWDERARDIEGERQHDAQGARADRALDIAQTRAERGPQESPLSRERFEHLKAKDAAKDAAIAEKSSLDSDVTKQARAAMIAALGPEATQEDVAFVNGATAAQLDGRFGQGIVSRALREQSDAKTAGRQAKAQAFARQMEANRQRNRVALQDSADQNRIDTENRDVERKKALANAPIPGFVVDDPEAAEAARREPTAEAALRKTVGQLHVMNKGMDDMKALRAKYGSESMPGAAKSQYNLSKIATIGGITSIAASGVLNGNEWDRYTEAVPDLTVSWRDILSGDIPEEQLEGVAAALRSMSDAQLTGFGGHYESVNEIKERRGDQSGEEWATDTGDSTPTGDETADAEASELGPLPTAPGKPKKVPKPTGDGMVRVRRKSDGKVGRMPMSNVDQTKYEVIR